jgi:hypothetical protein
VSETWHLMHKVGALEKHLAKNKEFLKKKMLKHFVWLQSIFFRARKLYWNFLSITRTELIVNCPEPQILYHGKF